MKFYPSRSACSVMAAATILAAVNTTAFAAVPKEKIGQMIMIGFRGTTPAHKGVQAVMQQLREGSIGGVMLLKFNITSARQLRQLTSALKQAAKQGGQLPPFIAVDQEGGAVQRLKFNRYPSARTIGRGSLATAGRVYRKLACELRASGINVNFGPVVDLDLRGKANPVVGVSGRSYSANPQTVIKFARQFIAAHKRAGVMTVAKHFPGHGSSLTDSHNGFTAIPKWNQLGNELAPYSALAAGGPNKSVDMVMIGHLYNKAWGAPATLSYKAVTGLLRRKVEFNSISITDDMEMGAIRQNYGWNDAIFRAVKAGNDVLLYNNTIGTSPYLGRKIRNAIAKSICTSKKANCIKPQTITTAYNRIAAIKRRYAAKPARCR